MTDADELVRRGTPALRDPDRVVVVDRDRVADLPLAGRLCSDSADVMLEGELRRVDSDYDEPVVAVGLGPRAYVRLRPQPVDAGERPEVHDDDLAEEAMPAASSAAVFAMAMWPSTRSKIAG